MNRSGWGGLHRRCGEAFWRAHHEAWRWSELNEREYCEAQGISLKAFGNWRAKFKAEPQPPARKLLYRRAGLSHTLSHGLSHSLGHMTYGSPESGPIVPSRTAKTQSVHQQRIRLRELNLCADHIILIERVIWGKIRGRKRVWASKIARVRKIAPIRPSGDAPIEGKIRERRDVTAVEQAIALAGEAPEVHSE